MPGYGGESAEVRFKLADGATVEDVDGTRVILGASSDAAALNATAGEVLDAVRGAGEIGGPPRPRPRSSS